MRVLLVNDLPPGPGSGVEVYLQRLSDGLTAAGDEVAVFAGEVVHRGAAKVLDLWDPWARRAVAARAREVGADVVHHHNVVRELSVSVLGATPGIPTVLTVHDQRLLGEADQPWRGVRATVDRFVKRPVDLRVARRHTDLAVGVTEHIAGRLRAAGFANVTHVAVPATPPTATCRPPSTCHDVVFAGRLTHDKGAHVLLAAFEEVSRRHPASRLLVAGDGPERDRLETAARRSEHHDRIRLLGRLDATRLSEVFGSARVVVVPSLPSVRPEGASLVSAEAALHGRPVIASDDPAVREVVERLGAGPIVRAGSVTDLVSALDRLVADGDEADRLGNRARREAERVHHVDAVVARMRDLYRSLVPEHARG